jgi:hypothetical protein
MNSSVVIFCNVSHRMVKAVEQSYVFSNHHIAVVQFVYQDIISLIETGSSSLTAGQYCTNGLFVGPCQFDSCVKLAGADEHVRASERLSDAYCYL